MSEPIWRAKWIWSGEPCPRNGYRVFRKTFEWPEERTWVATAYISASTMYKVYLNGRLVTNGPAPSTPVSQTYDEAPMTLVGGQVNTLTILVHYIGVPVFSYYQNRGGLLFQMDEIVSDETWLVAKNSPWDPGSPRLTIQQGFTEYYDARAEPIGAFGGDIDETEWLGASIVSEANGGPWPLLEARNIAQPAFARADDDLRVIEWGNCGPAIGEDVAERMQGEVIRPLTSGAVIRSADPDAFLEIIPGGQDLSILFDFGKEVSGFVKLCVEGEAAGAVLDIGYDEVLRIGQTPSGMYLHDPQSSQLSYADSVILRDGVTVFRGFGARAFRYLRIAIRDLKVPLKVQFLTLVESTYPVNRLGSFTCSDARLEKIWEVGRRTLQLCMDDRFMDCPRRERAQWIGDARIEALGAALCFGDTALYRRALRQLAQAQHADGRIDPVGPGEWAKHANDTTIPSFMCLWIEGAWDHFELTGDGDVLIEIWPSIMRAFDWLGRYASGPGGLLADLGHWNFIDWAEGLIDVQTGICASLNLLYLSALRTAAKAAACLDRQTVALDFARKAQTLEAAFVDQFWDSKSGVYVDLVRDGRKLPKGSQQANALALLLNIGSDGQQASVAEQLTKDADLTPIASPHFSYYLLKALMQHNKHKEALEIMRINWGSMLDHGATSWWEVYNPVRNGSSYCHAWSIAPTIQLITDILGVQLASPGFAQVRIEPHPMDLTWAKGIVPLPNGGDIVCSWTNSAARFVLDVSLPAGTLVQAVLPAEASDRVLVDGEAVPDDAVSHRTPSAVHLCVMPGSGYRFEVIRDERV
ncbi:MAG: alpha-L-rhamnosidase C-terminal domain-containing protein [Capsulimonadaceae bacterium]|nr:alpha-L-rhamnosidase C-terminal domain-containing protein [Capsulimonadaceae bacterium]